MTNVKDLFKDFYTIDEAIALDFEETKELQLKHLNRVRTIDGHAKYFVKADGCDFTEYDGTKHLDMIGAVGVVTVGNNNEFVWDALKKCFDAKLFMMGAISYHNVAAAFAHNMYLMSPRQKLSKIGTATGGAEAVEGTIKLVKLATRNKPEKTHILSCIGAFHGKTSGSVSVGGKDKWRAYQTPLMMNIEHVPYGDLKALEEALKTNKYKAFFVEPIQGEGGIIVPPAGYLKAVRELCTKYDTYMVCDEIQSGCARTGKFWCCEHDDVVPDVIIFAKGFSGGLIPFGGYLTSEELYEAAYGSLETAYHHTATYQENTMSSAAGLASMQYILENDLIQAAETKGKYMMEGMRKIQAKYPTVLKEVRGKGLMIGLEFFEVPEKAKAELSDYYAAPVCLSMVEDFNVQVNFTINNPAVFRFLPPLIVTNQQIDDALEALEKAIDKIYTIANK